MTSSNATTTMSNSLPAEHALPFFSELEIQFHISGAGDDITNRFCNCLEKELKSVKRHAKGNVLVITINQCSKGGRWSRMCCAELGMGWIRLNMRWELKDSNSNKSGAVLASGKCNLEDSGNIGCSDLCERSVPMQYV